MSVTHGSFVRTAIAQLVSDCTGIDGYLCLLEGSRELVRMRLCNPAFNIGDGGAMEMAGLPVSGLVSAGGTADTFEIQTAGGYFVLGGSVTGPGGGGDMELDSFEIAKGGTVQIDSFTYRAPD